MWSNRRTRSQEYKQIFEARWQYYWASYRSFLAPLDDPLDWWRSNESIPTIFKIIETLLPRYVLGMFQAPDWFSVEARNGRNEQYETMVQNLLRTTIEEMKVFPKMYEALKYALIMGHAWGKSVWREDYETRQVMRPTPIPYGKLVESTYGPDAVQQLMDTYGPDALDEPSPVMGMAMETVTEEVYNGPDFDWRPVDRIFPDPSGNGKWYIEDITTTLEELRETQRELQIYDNTTLNALEQQIPMSSLGDTQMTTRGTGGGYGGMAFEYNREPESTEGIPEYYVSPGRDGTPVTLWQCWGWVPREVKRYNDGQWRLTVIANGKYVLRDDPSPTPDGKPPYFPIRSIIIPGRLYGESLINWIGPLADQQTRLANMRLDEVFLGVWGQFIARADSIVSDNQLFVQPGGIIQVDPRPGEKAGDAFTALQRQPLLPQAYTEDQYRQTQAEHASFASDIFQGVSPMGGTTATEVERRLQQGNAPHVLSVMYNDFTVTKELLTRTWKWMQMRMPGEKLVRITDGMSARVNIQDIQIPIDIVVGGGMSTMSKDARIQMDQELIQMAANPTFMMFMKPDKILQRWMKDRGWKSPETFIKTQEEVMLEQLQQQMAASGQPMQAGGQMGAPQDSGGALPAEAGPYGQANQPNMPDMLRASQDASLVGGQLAPGGLVAPSI